jgi:endonuclease YncB( thermonuclease family)
MTRERYVLLLIVLAGCHAAASRPGRPASASKARPPASLPMPARPTAPGPVWRIVSVHDGDTLRALDEGNVERKVRLVGIDAPELGQAFGRVSRDRLRELALRQRVVVELHDRDRYGRELATVVIDGASINRQMVAEGMAWHFTRYSADADLAAAEAAARAARIGLWSDAAPVAPWQWRAGEAERKR